MILKKPYAFFVKYFRLINFIIGVLYSMVWYKMSSLHNALNGIFNSSVTNFTSLNSTYLGFSMFLLMFVIAVFLIIVIILLKRKDKPLLDYLLGLIYLCILLVFFLSISNLFLSLDSVVIEPSTMKVYVDISLIFMIPPLYLIFKYITIAVGFNLKKFNFTKDIIELKAEEDDDEEVELMFVKDTYKYKRGIRKYFREMKYYASENRLFIYIVLSVIVFILLSSFVGARVFNSNEVSVNKTFVAGTFSYNVSQIYETKYSSQNNIVKKDYKFVIAHINVRNNTQFSSSINYDRIRLFYGNNYVYANNYYNKYFLDLGNPYDGSLIPIGEVEDYIFIFKVPTSYKSNKYTLKFYSSNIVENEELKADYKIVDVKSRNLDVNKKKVEKKFNEKIVFDEKKYGKSEVTINSAQIATSYKYKNGESVKIITPKTANDVLYVIDYDLNIDSSSKLLSSVKSDKDFFMNFVQVEYELHGLDKIINFSDIVNVGSDNKIFISVPYNFKNSKNCKIIIKFRDIQYIYNNG